MNQNQLSEVRLQFKQDHLHPNIIKNKTAVTI